MLFIGDLHDLAGARHADEEHRDGDDGEEKRGLGVGHRVAAECVDDAQHGEAEDRTEDEGEGHAPCRKRRACFGIARHHRGQCAVGNVDAGVKEYQHEVHAETPDRAQGDAPVHIGVEAADIEQQHRDAGVEDPGAVAAKLMLGVIRPVADHGVVDRVPELRDQNDRTDKAGGDQGHIGEVEGEVAAHQRPRAVAGHVAEGVADLGFQV